MTHFRCKLFDRIVTGTMDSVKTHRHIYHVIDTSSHWGQLRLPDTPRVLLFSVSVGEFPISTELHIVASHVAALCVRVVSIWSRSWDLRGVPSVNRPRHIIPWVNGGYWKWPCTTQITISLSFYLHKQKRRLKIISWHPRNMCFR